MLSSCKAPVCEVCGCFDKKKCFLFLYFNEYLLIKMPDVFIHLNFFNQIIRTSSIKFFYYKKIKSVILKSQMQEIVNIVVVLTIKTFSAGVVYTRQTFGTRQDLLLSTYDNHSVHYCTTSQRLKIKL